LTERVKVVIIRRFCVAETRTGKEGAFLRENDLFCAVASRASVFKEAFSLYNDGVSRRGAFASKGESAKTLKTILTVLAIVAFFDGDGPRKMIE
jgi:hypothetical protein